MTIPRSLGYVGAAIVLTAYGLSHVGAAPLLLGGLNLLGALALGLDAYHRKAVPFIILNAAWALIALGGLA